MPWFWNRGDIGEDDDDESESSYESYYSSDSEESYYETDDDVEDGHEEEESVEEASTPIRDDETSNSSSTVDLTTLETTAESKSGEGNEYSGPDDGVHTNSIAEDIPKLKEELAESMVSGDSGRETNSQPADPTESSIDLADETDKNPVEKGEEEEGEEEVTTLTEKQSLLILAAEHDRVDILQAILSNDDPELKSALLNPVVPADSTDETKNSKMIVTNIPPLHVAVSYGSCNTVNCLLRMGADPSLRPDVSVMEDFHTRGKESRSDGADGVAAAPPVEIPNVQRFDGLSAWELAFQTSSTPRGLSSWFNSSSSSFGGDSGSGIQIPPSKKEGIRHAFTAEALRCIGSDEVERLQQLLDAGMPFDTNIGDKGLGEWAVDMEATQCQEALRLMKAKSSSPEVAEAPKNPDVATEDGTEEPARKNMESSTRYNSISDNARKSAVLDRGIDPTSVNRLDELESLAKALSQLLDNLAEEVSVCAGLLLVGSGASALASHVRSLKAKKERKYYELERMQQAWENCEDELAYWVKECPDGDSILRSKEVMMMSSPYRPSHVSKKGAEVNEETTPIGQASGSSTRESAEREEEEQSEARLAQQRLAQVSAMESKIRMLRASIADLSEENARNLTEVERRGLSGGIKLVRGLREEIREIEYQLSECKSGEAVCRAKICLIQTMGKTSKIRSVSKGDEDKSSVQIQKEEMDHNTDQYKDRSSCETLQSERIESGQSTAIVVRGSNGDRGLFSLWQIILRIVGLGERSSRGSAESRPVMII